MKQPAVTITVSEVNISRQPTMTHSVTPFDNETEGSRNTDADHPRDLQFFVPSGGGSEQNLPNTFPTLLLNRVAILSRITHRLSPHMPPGP